MVFWLTNLADHSENIKTPIVGNFIAMAREQAPTVEHILTKLVSFVSSRFINRGSWPFKI